jgi:hypothetical protein
MARENFLNPFFIPEPPGLDKGFARGKIPPGAPGSATPVSCLLIVQTHRFYLSGVGRESAAHPAFGIRVIVNFFAIFPYEWL